MKRIFKTILAASIVLLAASCTNRSKYNPDDFYNKPGSGEEEKEEVENIVDASGALKLMSFNVRYGSADDGLNGWTYRRDDLYKMIKTEKPLVIGLQECQMNQRNDIVDNCTEYAAIGVGRDDGAGKGETCSILYHKGSVEIVKWGSFWLSETPDVPGKKGWDANNVRVATWARIKVKENGKEFFYINTHLDHKGPTARSEGMKLIMKKFDELNTANLPQLLTADFNTSQDDPIFTECLKTMQNARLVAPKTDNKGTYNGWVGGKTTCIDHLFLSGFDILEYKTVDQVWGKTVFISDHYPVYALAKFKK